VSRLRSQVSANLIAFAAVVCISATARCAFELRGSRTKSLVVRAVAHEWWWEFDYPTLGINGTNELHVPIGTKIHLQLVSADVIHSLWIPGLNKATPIVPGTCSTLTLLVNSPGHFYGNCDAGCGCDTVCMRFPVIADSSADFKNWIKLRRPGTFHPQHVSATPACARKPSTMPRDSSKVTARYFDNDIYSAHAHRLVNLSEYKQIN